MGYMLKGQCSGGYYSVPHWIFDGGVSARLSPSAFKLLLFLHHVMHRVSNPRFFVAETLICAYTGADRKTISKARQELEKKGLLHCPRAAESGAPYLYELLNPETHQPYPTDRKNPATFRGDREKQAQVKRPKTSKRARNASTSHPQPPKNADATQRSTPEVFSCSVHGEQHLFEGEDGKTHCGLCERDPYAPEPSRPQANEFRVPSDDQVFGTSGRSSRY